MAQQQPPPDETITISTMPQVLTRAVIPTLAVTALDASDVLELYYLTRPTVFHAFPTIEVTKAALGLRYRPSQQQQQQDAATASASAMGNNNNKPLELTLEYGAARAGADLNHESLPRVVVDDNDNNQGEATSVSWDNEAKIYYTERIHPGVYTTANYLASLSGTVLEKFLQSAVDWMEGTTSSVSHGSRRHRRYQPLGVALALESSATDDTGNNNRKADDENNEKIDTQTTPQQRQQQILLRSSSDVDFLQQLYRVLADLGVQLQPVILPVQTHIRLHAAADIADGSGSGGSAKKKAAIQKVAVGVDVPPHVPAAFYQQLYDCVQSIARANYTTTASTTTATAGSNNNNNSNTTTSNNDEDRPPRRLLPPDPEGDVETKTASPTTTAVETSTIAPSTTSSSSMGSGGVDDGDEGDESTEDAPNDDDSSTTTGTAPTDDDDTTVPDHTAQAAEAAAHAQEAASAANEADNSHDAQAAAQKAATAAQEAASVTAQQAAHMAQQALQSGDAGQVAQTIGRLCFAPPPPPPQQQPTGGGNTSLPAPNAATNNNVTAYIYWDGAFYYRVDLVPPYISIVTEPQVMPHPPVAGISREDFVDWAIFALMALIAAAGFVLLLQQICGLRIVPQLYRYQRWFFQPRHCSLDDDDEEDTYYNKGGGGGGATHQNRGGGKPFSFGADAIPLSMGGRRMATVFSNRDDARFFEQAEHWLKGRAMTSTTPRRQNSSADGGGGGSNSVSSIQDDEYDNEFEEFLGSAGGGDLELVPPSSSQFPSSNSFVGRFHDGNDEDAVSEHSSTLDGTPSHRLFRDPNLVDLPDLKSRSKVAVPVSISYNNNNNSKNNSGILD